MPLQEGNRRVSSRVGGFLVSCHSVQPGFSAGVTVTPLLGSFAKPIACSRVAPPLPGRKPVSPEPLPLPIRLTNYFPGRLAVWNGVGAEFVAAAPPLPGDAAAPQAPRSLLTSTAVHLPALTVHTVKPDVPSGRRLAGDPARQAWMPPPAAVPVERNQYPTAADAVTRKLRPALPLFEEFAIDGPRVALDARFQRSPAPELAVFPARPRLVLSPAPLLREESTAVRYPDVARLHLAEDLLKDVGVAPPAGFADTPAPDPAASRRSFAAFVLASMLNEREPAALSTPTAPEAIVTGDARLVPAPLAPLLAPSVVEPLPAATAADHAAGPLAWEPRTHAFSTSAADLRLAPQPALAPFAELPAPHPAKSPANAPSAACAIGWALNPLRTATTNLHLDGEAALAPFAASPAPSPVDSLPAIPAFDPGPLATRPDDRVLQLPAMVHRPLYAQPAAAPATRVTQFPSVSRGKSRSATCAMTAPTLRLPKYTPAGPVGDAETKPLVPRLVSFVPSRAASAPEPISTVPPASLPSFSSSERPEITAAGFDPPYPSPIEPAPDSPHRDIADLRPIPTLPVNPAAIEAECTPSAVPQPTFIPVEFYLQRASASPRWTSAWISPPVATIQPPFILPLIEDRTEDPVTRPIEQTPSTVTEIFSHPDARRLARQRMMGYLAKIAACVIVALFLGFGARELSMMSGQRLLGDRAIAPIEVQPSARSYSSAPAGARASGAPPADTAPKGFWGRAQQAIARRAAVEAGDNFRAGMESWGSPAKTWAPGWSRNPAGYVNLGGLELFRPSLNFTDYRLEFFGQIESKGMGWVMRGHDKQNYYAMKFQVIQAGLRPVISMVHYPVVDGVKGHKVETPLNIMVHHNEPFHVSVDVAGNRFTASVEGQKIDSWTDDAPPVGGAGFFTEASERARLYWMKVTKNDDFLGLICSFLAGNSARDVAELWGPGLPQDTQTPTAPARSPDVILTGTAGSLDDFGGRRYRSRPAALTLQNRRKNFEYRRNPAWNS